MSQLISIALTTYNGEQYIEKQLDSLLNQTYKNIEIIICDDCSTDSTISILSKYADKYPQIKIFLNKENLGFTKNFEKAMKLCSGDYIALCDQDDIWLPDKLELSLQNIGSNSVFCCPQFIIDEHENIIYKIHPSLVETIKRAKQCNNNYFKMLLFRNFCAGCTILMRREFLSQILPIPDKIYHDWWIALIASYYNVLTFYHQPLIYYRWHSSNETAKTNIRNKNKKIPSSLNYLFHLLFDNSYSEKWLKTVKNNSSILLELLNHIDFNQNDKIYIRRILELNNSKLNFNLNFRNLSCLYFEFKNLKYISTQWNYFPFSVILRFVLKIKVNTKCSNK